MPCKRPPERALEHLVAVRETLFDPLCVDAFLDLMAQGRLRVDPARLDAEELAAAAEACHPAPSRSLLRRRAG